ncbi:MAG: BON domain-containing protein [Gammaproteobacteria bacterium]|nr:BON domain-containing protein [Gammaproteobacteria bacterium]
MTNFYRSLSVVLITIILSGCAPAVIVGGTAIQAVHDRRTLGSFVEDQNIELKAYDALSKIPEFQDTTHVSITSYNGIVLISGETPTHGMRNQVGEIIRTLPKVKKVHNELAIAAPSSIGTRSADTWLTTKVKTSLFKIDNHKGFDPTRVKVITENGTVYLMGLVKKTEADDVVNITRKVDGVQRVVKIFEYIN